jgi:hypothetical protein
MKQLLTDKMKAKRVKFSEAYIRFTAEAASDRQNEGKKGQNFF